MNNVSIYKNYIPSAAPRDGNHALARMFVFNSEKLLIKMDAGVPSIPTEEDLNKLGIEFTGKQYLGELAGYPCYCMQSKNDPQLPESVFFKELRTLLGQIEEDLFLLAGRAFQMVNWDQMNQYCGKCGATTEAKQDEWVKKCPACGSQYYPRISPAIIVAVVRDGKILLAHNKNFRQNWHSVLAGFVEPGERFEDCVRREVMEEVGIRIKNIKYFGSQPWPFPDSLMVGFTAEYESGEILVDGTEIDHAAWYESDSLPQRPSEFSIAGQLIEAFVNGQKV